MTRDLTSISNFITTICKPIVKTILLLLILCAGIYSEVPAQVVKQPVSDISTTVKHYNYTYLISATQKKDIRYIIVEGSNGDIKTCFDACDVCYPYNKGYVQNSTQLRCNNCGNKYNIDGLGTQGKGGCWPGFLSHTLQGDSVVINVSDLVEGAYYFPAVTISDVNDNNNSDCASISIIQQNDELTINMSSSMKRNFKIVSLNGLICKSITKNSKEVSVNINNLTSGVYILSVEENGKLFSKLFFINR